MYSVLVRGTVNCGAVLMSISFMWSLYIFHPSALGRQGSKAKAQQSECQGTCMCVCTCGRSHTHVCVRACTCICICMCVTYMYMHVEAGVNKCTL